ncbi:hypothetical protein SB759_04890 [Pseudomonas sp. SIMBA_059]|uniref:Chemotaxis methyl-accepting receptor HlyB-like 4HB MCP domain-containing protein n=1 Tax=Pseudomonas palleroniana TaxID=191390 RepID=A0A0X7JZJ4_9PSED|nr:hypothetical protein [Pseudomonas palleroniana]KWU48848.1 hypothetical protein AWV77_19990 [Pseudomonas palleroniana]
MTFKRKKTTLSFARLGIPLLTIAASLGGVYMGQRMIAVGESNKVIREKLAMAYNMNLEVPDLALAVNMSATEIVTPATVGFKGGNYNKALNAYRAKLTEIKTINELYVDEITPSVIALSRCSEVFVNYAANHMLLEARDAGLPITHDLMSYRNPSKKLERNESLDATAHTRVKCELVGDQLNASIAQVMKKHI